jgi:hypothetical protein
MLSLAEGREILAFLTAGTLPPLMARTGGTTFFVYALDLGFVAPLCILASIWLWRQAAWGYILASCLLIKAATMGLALLSMDWFAGRAGLPSDGLEGIWTVITAGGLGLSIWLFQHCRE